MRQEFQIFKNSNFAVCSLRLSGVVAALWASRIWERPSSNFFKTNPIKMKIPKFRISRILKNPKKRMRLMRWAIFPAEKSNFGLRVLRFDAWEKVMRFGKWLSNNSFNFRNRFLHHGEFGWAFCCGCVKAARAWEITKHYFKTASRKLTFLRSFEQIEMQHGDFCDVCRRAWHWRYPRWFSVWYIGILKFNYPNWSNDKE